jgi:HK97 family phage prohead protease
MIAAVRFPNGLETRTAIELRASGRTLHGYAATFDTPAQIGAFTETIRVGAFRASLLAPTDKLALVDHDPTKVLARTSAGNLKLTEDSRGLRFEIDLPGTSLANDVLALVESRTAGGMSFGFHVKDQHWPTRGKRELRVVDLVEVSVVSAFPAYSGTSIAARAMARAEASARIRRMMMGVL